MEWFVDGTGLSCWCCRVHEFHKWVFVRHSDIVLLQPFRWCCVDCERHVNSTFFQSLWFSIVQTQVHFICPTGNFRKGVVRLNCFAKWVAAWKRVKTAGLVHIELFLLFNALHRSINLIYVKIVVYEEWKLGGFLPSEVVGQSRLPRCVWLKCMIRPG